MRYLILVVLFCFLQGGRWQGCPTPCVKCIDCANPDNPSTWCTDIDRNSFTDVGDLLAVLGNWGLCPTKPEWCRTDVNGDDVTDAFDLILVLRNLRCPQKHRRPRRPSHR